MDVEIISKEENQLLGRKEIRARVRYEGATPKRSEVKEAVCKKLGLNPDLAVVRSVKGEYGMQAAKVHLHAYESEERLKELEPEYVQKRNGMRGEESGEGKEG